MGRNKTDLLTSNRDKNAHPIYEGSFYLGSGSVFFALSTFFWIRGVFNFPLSMNVEILGLFFERLDSTQLR